MKNDIVPIVNNRLNFCTSFSLEDFPKLMSFLLLFCVVWGTYKFGLNVLILILSTVCFFIFLDFLFLFFSKKFNQNININRDYYFSQSVMNGLLIALIQNTDTPLFIPLITVAVAFLIKISFGFSNAWINPVLFSLLFSYIAFGDHYIVKENPDVVSSSSVLVLKKQVNFSQSRVENLLEDSTLINDKKITSFLNNNLFSKFKLNISFLYISLLFGNLGTSIGGSNAILLLLIYIFLYSSTIIKHFVSPVTYFFSFIFFSYTFGGMFENGFFLKNLFTGTPLLDILSGGFLFSFLFLIPNTFFLPLSNFSMFLYGFFAGFFLFLFRYCSPYPDGIIPALCLAVLFSKVFETSFLESKEFRLN